MMQQWQQLLDRIDALSLRERLFLFLSAFVCVLAAGDFIWFTPAQTAHKQLVQRFAAQGSELNRLRSELSVVAVPHDPSKEVRAELEATLTRLDELNTEITRLVPSDQKGPPLEQVLQRLLRSQDGLTLLSLDTLQVEAPAVAAANAATAALPAGMNRRALVLRVAGPYAGLVRYVQALETAMPGLRWGSMELKADKRSNELTLQVYVLGVQP